MFLRSAPTPPRQFRFPSRLRQSQPRRKLTTPHNHTPTPTHTATIPKDVQAQSRLRRLNDRLPSFLRAYTTPLLGAPATHITSFLILHEITAIIPLFGLVAAFHYGNWVPDLTSYSGFEEGSRRFTKWLRKKGWVGEDVDAEEVVAAGTATENGKEGVRLVLEFATAYVVTKALLPVRIAGSVWATPWFARVVLAPVGRRVRGLFRR
ncbi:hypothetical protein BDW59DRAFT_68549 [Aspergillus cavernicola]|uniref:DUF1279 domain-containing protein n=1 Tax=Aspergillus cavernicola TaxID=176166 RepID=A0ABR4IDX3_9EURO